MMTYVAEVSAQVAIDKVTILHTCCKQMSMKRHRDYDDYNDSVPVGQVSNHLKELDSIMKWSIIKYELVHLSF